MNCMICGNEFESKRSSAKYCSANCRVKAGRVSVTEPRLSVTGPEVSVTKPEVSVTRLSVTEVSVTEQTNKPDNYLLVSGDKVYHRQAVKYIVDGFDTRPIPDNVEDKPVKGNRGRYKREDGSQYQIDDAGISHQLELIDGNYRVCLV